MCVGDVCALDNLVMVCDECLCGDGVRCVFVCVHSVISPFGLVHRPLPGQLHLPAFGFRLALRRLAGVNKVVGWPDLRAGPVLSVNTDEHTASIA